MTRASPSNEKITHKLFDRSGKLVTPGDKLGVIEEFIPGSGTYVEEGTIYSTVVGYALLDVPNKRISVYPVSRRIIVPKVGNIVVGQVTDVQTKIALIRIFRVEGRKLSGFFTGTLHISDVSTRYVENMFDVCRVGDIARARVISEKNAIFHLTMAERNLGVLFAFCSECGYALRLRRMKLMCSRCNKIEKRKIAVDYGKGKI